ncbi:Hydantoinase/oxoprolinase N-terminal region-domain-containing protein [Amylostereum chailletii]|nr:Hydantoinase/oxoprolinase N-terminal region-domain-containing protein [Amylostereum chailletii]
MASLRIGVDVGGTNTDGVLLDPTRLQEPTHGILAWHKTPTTADPSSGIEDVIAALFQKADVDSSTIASVTIGTTHFINAVLEKDQNRLAPVAVLRLCGPFALTVSAGIDWPDDLRRLICVYQARLKGGLEVDGNLIGEIDEDEIAEHARIIKAKGIRSIVINGVFSPVDIEHLQEERAREIVLKVYPEADVVISKEVANLGFVERENAAILNASILRFAQQTIAAFRRAMTGRLNLACPIFLTQNDGTIMPAHLAARLPIRTFASGSTNSMCGARFLAQSSAGTKEAILVVDIGGTSTDVGMLLSSGFPRQAAAFTELVGIRMNFSCPDVKR